MTSTCSATAGWLGSSTLGTFLRSFTHGHVQQLDAVGGGLLAGLAGRVPGLIAGAGTAEGIAFIDVDDTVRGGPRLRQAGRRLRLHPPARSEHPARHARHAAGRAGDRAGSAAARQHRLGAGRLLAQAVTTARHAGVRSQIVCRADSAYYGWAFVGTAIRHQAWFSVTARMDPKVKAAIAGIDDAAWQTISYPNAVFDSDEQRWVSDAEVAEVPFTAFTGRRKAQHVTCRLIVRRVRRLQPQAGDGTEQGELFRDLPAPRVHHQLHPRHRPGRPCLLRGHSRSTPRTPPPPASVDQGSEGGTRRWTSPQRPSRTNVRFDHEFEPGCGEDATRIEVVDQRTNRIPNAEVFVNGRLRGTTNHAGRLVVEPALKVGDELVARQLVHQQRTPRRSHDQDSQEN